MARRTEGDRSIMNKEYYERLIMGFIIFLFIVFMLVVAVYGDTGMKIYKIDKTRPHIDRAITLNYTILKTRMDHVDLVRRDTFLMPERVKKKIQHEIDAHRYWLIRGRHLRQRRRIK